MECYCQGGTPHVVGIHEKTSMALPFFLETGDYIPPRVTEEELAALTVETEAALLALGVRDSLAHVEIKQTNHGPQVIEIASRMGGDYIGETIQKVYGFDLVKAGCEIALGIAVTERASAPRTCIMGRYFIPEQSGVVANIRGRSMLRNHPGVVDFSISKTEGDSIAVPPLGYETAGWVLIEGKTHIDAERVMEEIMRGVKLAVSPLSPCTEQEQLMLTSTVSFPQFS